MIPFPPRLDQAFYHPGLIPSACRFPGDKAAKIEGPAVQFAALHRQIDFGAALVSGHGFEL